jgi:hypothetical protein
LPDTQNNFQSWYAYRLTVASAQLICQSRTVDITPDIKDALRKFRFGNSKEIRAISGETSFISGVDIYKALLDEHRSIYKCKGLAQGARQLTGSEDCQGAIGDEGG